MGVGFVFYCLMLLWLTQVVQAASKNHCPNKCGNVSISSPFGIGRKCYANPSFEVTCNKTSDGRRKPFLKALKLELLYSDWQSVIVNNPVIHFNCDNNDKDDHNYDGVGAFDAILKPGSPFSFSFGHYFGTVGGGNLATILSNQIPISGCLQAGRENGYCHIQNIPENLASLAVNFTENFPGAQESNRCSSAFIFYPSMMDYSEGPGIGATLVPVMLQWDPDIKCDSEDCQELGRESKRISCTRKCGGADVEFPFGIEGEAGCYLNEWFKVSCNQTDKGIEKAFINKVRLELLNTSFSQGQVLVNNPITYSKCHNKDRLGFSVDLTGSPFFFSDTSNVFGFVGCGNLATIFRTQIDPIGGCLRANCSDETSSFGSCDLSIPPGLSSFAANIVQIYPSNGSNVSCPSAFMIDTSSWYDVESPDQINGTHVPVTLQFAMPKTGYCELKEGSNTVCSSDLKYCWTNLTSMHLCVCSYEFTGYATDVCREIGKCSNPKYKMCYMLCLNEPGKYCSPTSCPKGYVYDKTIDGCKPKGISSKDSAILIGCSTSTGTLLLLLATWCMYKLLKKRRKIKRKQRYFKRNGGLLLQQQLFNNESKNEKIRFFTSKELEKATDHYNENRILGQGAQGTVYKGMLADGRIVAIKKSKVVEDKKKRFLDEKQVEQWVNEVIILSQINHRNVVKLLGCCLETRFPLLVYEFVPNGTLFQMIHNPTEEFPLTWEMRLRIAIEVTSALSYLHSAASVPIYHRDIKSTNILLDDKYRAKVSDFGISKSVGLEQTHLTTQVQGTFGYLDPEYFRSNQFTEKSDVYSFGVVLAEILTGQKPFSSIQPDEEVRSLVHFFLHSMDEGSLFDTLDPRVKIDGPQEEIIAVARLAKRCLNLNGKKRPTMRQVAMELEYIRTAREEVHSVQEISDDADEDSEDDSTSIFLSNDSVTLSIPDPDACTSYFNGVYSL